MHMSSVDGCFWLSIIVRRNEDGSSWLKLHMSGSHKCLVLDKEGMQWTRDVLQGGRAWKVKPTTMGHHQDILTTPEPYSQISVRAISKQKTWHVCVCARASTLARTCVCENIKCGLWLRAHWAIGLSRCFFVENPEIHSSVSRRRRRLPRQTNARFGNEFRGH